MDDAGFRAYLKKSDKKAHVVDGLVAQVQRFANYLTTERGQAIGKRRGPRPAGLRRNARSRQTRFGDHPGAGAGFVLPLLRATRAGRGRHCPGQDGL